MRVAVTGASGFIGSALVPALRSDGHSVLRLVRREPRDVGERQWDPALRRLDPGVLGDVDAVVHLAGAGVADRRWTPEYQRTIETSRVDSTLTVSEALAAAEPRPRVLLSASAVGWYGETGDRVVEEGEPAGSGFLADVCRQWEAATAPAEQAGVRVAHLRTGLVLTRRGGVLQRILPIFRWGLGGRLSSGRQYWPWISLADEVNAIKFLLGAESVSGPVNLTGPAPVTNAEFTRALARAVHRPALFPVPAFALRIVLGGLAQDVLTGQRAVPAVLRSAGYQFAHPDLDSALRWGIDSDGSVGRAGSSA